SPDQDAGRRRRRRCGGCGAVLLRPPRAWGLRGPERVHRPVAADWRRRDRSLRGRGWRFPRWAKGFGGGTAMMHEPPDARTSSPAAARQWALVVIGAWLMGSICTSIVATQNFYTIDRLLAASPNDHFKSAVALLGQPQARDLLRYLSSELNRLYFQIWNGAQLVFGAVVLWL